MKTIRAILVLIILAEITAAVWQFFAFERAATRSAAALPAVASAHAAVIEDMIDKHAYGIRADVIKEANAITKPKHWYEKALGPVLDVARILAALL